MNIEESTMITKVTYSKDRSSRYLLTKKWDEKLPKITVIMLIPGSSGVVQQDVTTACIIKCTSQLGFDSVDVTNIFSKLGEEISTDMQIEHMTDEDNDKVILESVTISTTIVLAWGKCDETNLKIKQRVESVMEMLSPFKDKLYTIGDGRGRSGFSPMYPRIRNGWELVKVSKEEKVDNSGNKRSKKASK